jgi:hypothetical protein
MSEFLTDLDCRLKDDDCVWVLDSPLKYQSDSLGLITVPAGFETDFASVPRMPIIYSMYGDRAHREAVIHDLLYRKDAATCVEFKEGLDKNVTLDQANNVFYEAMKCRGKSWIVRHGMYWGVCAGGRFSYHKKNVSDKIIK